MKESSDTDSSPDDGSSTSGSTESSVQNKRKCEEGGSQGNPPKRMKLSPPEASGGVSADHNYCRPENDPTLVQSSPPSIEPSDSQRPSTSRGTGSSSGSVSIGPFRAQFQESNRDGLPVDRFSHFFGSMADIVQTFPILDQARMTEEIVDIIFNIEMELEEEPFTDD